MGQFSKVLLAIDDAHTVPHGSLYLINLIIRSACIFQNKCIYLCTTDGYLYVNKHICIFFSCTTTRSGCVSWPCLGLLWAVQFPEYWSLPNAKRPKLKDLKYKSM